MAVEGGAGDLLKVVALPGAAVVAVPLSLWACSSNAANPLHCLTMP